ncbi:ABC transporter ATP-binding protein [Microbacterium dextranolyticum]|uniref:Multidrug ABC transporter ATP-binding protein n=1 Tax=Microbacterium dextranolyticum TaxID=36806 RepID=A0A9W6HN80_9MICO|nr:ABC transporter ATP-binding protein [Microbacterium dextranolyticum]MBM7462768.1 multidrug/hemolysin transport system ATP-binding protein [Microbacterium dextranolyticum]GLJ96128.1 multidrug ABC transporter ATP-binding protein [Microbacterium dextranolyticum]
MATTASAPTIVRGLTKRYGDVTAVDDVSFDVSPGEVFAFLGTNGAGKSTTIGALTTVIEPDAGSLTVAGRDARADGDAVRRSIGVVFQDSLLDAALTVRENLTVRARPYLGSTALIRERIASLTDLVDLGEFVDRRYGRLSGGQRRRADIARALLHDPEIVFLDEPTTGLDPASRQAVWRTVHELRERIGLTVFLTTHYLEETEQADRVCIIDRGRIIAQGTPNDLRARYSSSILTLMTAAGSERIVVADAAEARRILTERGDGILDFEFRHGRMDDVFLALTGRAADAVEGNAR